MTDVQMTDLFAVMMLAWPNAEMFKGGLQKLGPTIKLWTSRTKDIDFWLGEQAVGRLCDTCKFPPSIAEFREQAERIAKEIRSMVEDFFAEVKSADVLGYGMDDWCRMLPPDSIQKATVDAMGGPATLVTSNGEMWNYELYEKTLNRLLRNRDETFLPVKGGGYLPQGRDRT